MTLGETQRRYPGLHAESYPTPDGVEPALHLECVSDISVENISSMVAMPERHTNAINKPYFSFPLTTSTSSELKRNPLRPGTVAVNIFSYTIRRLNRAYPKIATGAWSSAPNQVLLLY